MLDILTVERAISGEDPSRLFGRANPDAAEKASLQISAFGSEKVRAVFACVVAVFFALFGVVPAVLAQMAAPQMPAGWGMSILGQDYLWKSPTDARGAAVLLLISKTPSQIDPPELRPWFEAMLSAHPHSEIKDSAGMLSAAFQLTSPPGAYAIAYGYQTRLGNQIITIMFGPGIDLNDPRAQSGVRTAIAFWGSKTVLTTGGMVVAGPKGGGAN